MSRLLLLANSKNPGGEYLGHAASEIKDFLGSSVRKVLFVPFATVVISYNEYAAKVRGKFQEMGYEVDYIGSIGNRRLAVTEAEAIVVGGGNTFQLLEGLYEADILESIQERVRAGVPYIGWSAGSNVACPTIKTTNDKPIVLPCRRVTRHGGFTQSDGSWPDRVGTLDAMNLVRFQISPHYLDPDPVPQRETDEERIKEFMVSNPGIYVAGMRNGSILRVENAEMGLRGTSGVRVFRSDLEPTEHRPGDSLDFLLK